MDSAKYVTQHKIIYINIYIYVYSPGCNYILLHILIFFIFSYIFTYR